MNNLGLNSSVYGEEGYSINLKLLSSDLETIRKLIRIQWLYRLQLLVPKCIHQFDNIGMEQYHELSHVIKHDEVWPKTSRVMPREAVEIIRRMDFFKKMESEFGEIKIADEEKLGWENIYWRVVRPGKSDIGSIHADTWFVKLGYYGDEIHDAKYERVKIWIPIYSVPGKNGLIVIPQSHKKNDWKWHAEERHGLKKPVIDEDLSKLNSILLPTQPGQSVIFNYNLLHGGAPNLADTTRVSMEFTFLIQR